MRLRPFGSALILSCLAVSAGASPVMRGEAPVAPKSSEKAATAPTWGKSLPDAIRQAKATGKPILVDLFAEWCTWCKVLEKEVFPTAQFRDFVRDKILLRVDTEDGGDGARLYARFGTQSLPTLVIVDSHLALMATVEGYAPADQWLAQARASLEQHRVYANRVKSALAATPAAGDKEKEFRLLVEEARRRADGPRAAALLEKLLAKAENPFRRIDLMNLADAYRLDQRFDEAERTARTARDEAAAARDRMTVERAELMTASIRSERGACGEARLALESFLREHPNSRFSGYAQQMLDALPPSDAAAGGAAGRCA